MGALFSSPKSPTPPPPPPPAATPPTLADSSAAAAQMPDSAAKISSAFGGTVTNKGGAQGLGDSTDTTRRSLLG